MMRPSLRGLADAVHVLLLTAWVGALWAVGYIAAPVLFATMVDRSLAGSLAGAMFSVIGYLGFACGGYLLLSMLARMRAGALKRFQFWLILLMLLLTLVQLFGLQPMLAQMRNIMVPEVAQFADVAEAAAKSRFATWHGVASVLYLVQSLVGVFAVLSAPRR